MEAGYYISVASTAYGAASGDAVGFGLGVAGLAVSMAALIVAPPATLAAATVWA